jgi:hypothetical protein
MFRHFRAFFREAIEKSTGLLLYFYWLYVALIVALKDRNMSAVYHTLFSIECNYTQVVGTRVVTFLAARDVNNLKSQRKISLLITLFFRDTTYKLQGTSCA